LNSILLVVRLFLGKENTALMLLFFQEIEKNFQINEKRYSLGEGNCTFSESWQVNGACKMKLSYGFAISGSDSCPGLIGSLSSL
jgi:hypothetical protein